MDRGARWATVHSPWGHKESDTTATNAFRSFLGMGRGDC